MPLLKSQSKNRYFRIAFSFVLCFVFIFGGGKVQAASIVELKNKIADHNQQIATIEAEIKKYEAEIASNSARSRTLQAEIRRLELTRKKLLAEIALTQSKIDESAVNIAALGEAIIQKEIEIKKVKDSLAEVMRIFYEEGDPSIMELTISKKNFSEFFDSMEQIDSYQKSIQIKMTEFQNLKEDLNNKKGSKEIEKKNFEVYKSQLADQKRITEITKGDTSSLLKATKNQETNYRKLLADRLAKKDELEKEISDFENQIKIVIDPSTLPETGSGVLSWPLDKIIITQYFGNTAFASKNPQVYNSKGHNGVDFSASIGTPVKSAAPGVIVGIGDTDTACAGASYGKWALIEHSNGLSTLYAHLSVIKVAKGDTVVRKQLIAYSGNTGYSTGPHLHFTVYASRAVSVQPLRSKVKGCGIYVLPVASQSGYLNPLSYL